jgi:hypothetical protein
LCVSDVLCAFFLVNDVESFLLLVSKLDVVAKSIILTICERVAEPERFENCSEQRFGHSEHDIFSDRCCDKLWVELAIFYSESIVFALNRRIRHLRAVFLRKCIVYW